MSDEQDEHLQSALSILEYGCEYGDFDNEVAAFKRLVAERDALASVLREIIDAHDQVSKMEHRDWERARDLLGGYRSPLADPE